jgi:uncharacterized protein with HEPN domain
MPPEARKLLTDMRDAADELASFVTGKQFDDFRRDKLLRSGVYWQFVVIGEALTQLRKLDQDLVSRISEYARIVAFRNQIIHGYGKIDDEITWRVLEQKLPLLRQDLAGLLAE